MNSSYQYDYSTGADAVSPVVAGGMFALFAGFMLVMLLFVAALYIYMAICLMKIGKKTGTDNAWFAWIPILNIVLMVMISKKPMWWIILFFIPLANIVAMVVIWMAISKILRKPEWLGILMIVPVANLVIPGYLAFSKRDDLSTSQVPDSGPMPPIAQ